jgi:Ribonuclease toxin, BrnT, of type II toxin-antitoxin system
MTQRVVTKCWSHFFLHQHDALRPLRQEPRRDLLVEAKKHKAWKLLRHIPGIASILGSYKRRYSQWERSFVPLRTLWHFNGAGISVDFQEALTVFADPLARIFEDEEHSEEEPREIIIGHPVKRRLVLVCFTVRDRRIRIKQHELHCK